MCETRIMSSQESVALDRQFGAIINYVIGQYRKHFLALKQKIMKDVIL